MSNKIRNPKDMKTLNQTIFREYDIRGKYPEDLNPSSIRSIAFSIAKKCKAESIDSLVIGRDGRLSGPELIKILEAELNNNGISTENIGVVTSPLLYFAAKKSATLSGIMLTGSHNPKNYNGIKMVINDQPISGKEIYEGISSKPSSFNQNQAVRKNLNVVQTYINEIVNSFSSIHKKIVVMSQRKGIYRILAESLLTAIDTASIALAPSLVFWLVPSKLIISASILS